MKFRPDMEVTFPDENSMTPTIMRDTTVSGMLSTSIMARIDVTVIRLLSS